MRNALAWALLLVAIILPVRACALNPFDDASFYVNPGEKPTILPLMNGNDSYYLVLVNSSAVALLYSTTNGSEPVVDIITLNQVLAGNADLIANATNKTVQSQLEGINAAADRIEQAMKRKAYFERQFQLNTFRGQWSNVSREFKNPRKLSLPLMDSMMEHLQMDLDNINRAKGTESIDTYSAQFDDDLRATQALAQDYAAILVNYRRSIVELVNATERINSAEKFGLMSGTQAAEQRRHVDAMWADVIDAEAMMIDGRSFTTQAANILDSITSNASTVGLVQAGGQADLTWAYVAFGLALLIILGIAAFIYLRMNRKGATASLKPADIQKQVSEGLSKIVERIRKAEQQ